MAALARLVIMQVISLMMQQVPPRKSQINGKGMDRLVKLLAGLQRRKLRRRETG
jgi:hypothetical protein